ncbi:MAG: hypothetical protein WCG27_06490, partial [Pseudomonadota bacterium]
GILAGVILWGLPDWIYYGRPWESAYMYVLYNIFAGLSKNWGEQSIWTYLQYFNGHWKGIFLVWILMAPFGLYGIYRGLKNLSPWAYAGLFYVGGHLLIAHKEPRFMIPVELLFIFISLYGFWHFKKNFEPLFNKMAFKIVLIVLFVVNLGLSLEQLKGDWGKAHQVYLNLPCLLKKNPDVCATIGLRKPFSFYFSAKQAVPLGYWGVRKKENVQDYFNMPLVWPETGPVCQEGQKILLQAHSTQDIFIQSGCQLAKKAKFWQKSVWYLCPAGILSKFSKVSQRKVLVHGIEKIKPLTPLSVSGKELQSYQDSWEMKTGIAYGNYPDLY